MSPLLPRSRGSQIYLGLLLAVAVGLVMTAAGSWRPGVAVIGGAFAVGALMRLVVPTAHEGMLRVRGRVFDVTWMTTLGAALIVLAIVVPNQPR